MKDNCDLTPIEVKQMPLDEFEQRFKFRPVDALEKCGFAMLGQRMHPETRAAIEAGILDMPDLTDVVMDEENEGSCPREQFFTRE